MKLLELSTGDMVYRYQKSIVVFFHGKRRVLSTSLYNGGLADDFAAVFNHDATQGAGMPCKMLADTYVEHMRLVAQGLGLVPEQVTGMGTAASMENVAVCSASFRELTVTAIVTGGIETNGGRVGDPADYYQPVPKDLKPGTINIILVIDADLPPGILARALVTCTEGKTAAIQELLAGSNYSAGLATGSGTDQTIIVSNTEAALFLESAGKHSKLGELIGQTVMRAVKEALYKQSGLCPSRQHDVFARLKRFKVTADTLWAAYVREYKTGVIKPVFLAAAEELGREDNWLTLTSLYVHLLDQHSWGLLQDGETITAAELLLGNLARLSSVADIPQVTGVLPEALLLGWSDLFLCALQQKLKIV